VPRVRFLDSPAVRQHSGRNSAVEMSSGRSRDRTICPPLVSAKREYFRTRPETFADFHLKNLPPSVQRKSNARKAQICSLCARLSWTSAERMNAWAGAGDRTSIWRIGFGYLACPRGAAESLFVESHRPFKSSEFREPYRIRGVQSFGDERAFRRTMSVSCRERVRTSNEKSLSLLGLMPTNPRGEYGAWVVVAEQVGFEPSLQHPASAVATRWRFWANKKLLQRAPS
jgi:hypothetical protein